MTTVFRTRELRIVTDTNTEFLGPCILAKISIQGNNGGPDELGVQNKQGLSKFI